MSKLDFINQKSLDPDLAVLDSLPFLEHQAWSDFLGKMKQEPRTSDTEARGPARAEWVWDLAHLPFSL